MSVGPVRAADVRPGDDIEIVLRGRVIQATQTAGPSFGGPPEVRLVITTELPVLYGHELILRPDTPITTTRKATP